MKFFRDNEAGGPPRIDCGDDEFAVLRAEMIEKQLRRRGVNDSGVLAAMGAVPREEFVPKEFRPRAYEDAPLPIGEGPDDLSAVHCCGDDRCLAPDRQRTRSRNRDGLRLSGSRPFKIGEALFSPSNRAPSLLPNAAARLERLGYSNVHVHCGDGTLGLPEFASFDAILVAAAAPAVPAPLRAQLAEGGRLDSAGGRCRESGIAISSSGKAIPFLHALLKRCRFVPLVGYHGWKEPPAR